MPGDRFFIAPYDKSSGLQTNYRPFAIPDEAFSELNNAYVFRGRVRKRFGSRWIGNDALSSRLRVNLGPTTGASFTINIGTILNDATVPIGVGQQFSILSIVFTVVNPAGGPQQMLRTDNLAAAATFNLTTSDLNITGITAPLGTSVYYYLGDPVMGELTFEQNTVNANYVIAFDPSYAYKYVAGWTRLDGEADVGAAIWHGSNSQFFWSCSWLGAGPEDRIFFVTNFNENEVNFMRYFDGALWHNFNPQLNNVSAQYPVITYLNCACILVTFKNRLIALNTWEGPAASLPGTNYVFRCRYSQAGSPLDVNAWNQSIPGRGSAIDAPTTEAIVTAEFVRDRLIVYFENSTYELAFTGNQAQPFQWNLINPELGAESTFSIVPFDKVCIGVGNVGIHACSGTVVERIDDKIPETVFEVHQGGTGVDRVYGIRDFHAEVVYWTFPDTQATSPLYPFPTRILVYNYKTGTWALNDDTITCFGYFQPIPNVTWDSLTVTWDDEQPWDGGEVQAQFRQVIAGNQQGYTFICDVDEPTNELLLQITNIITTPATILTIINHNLKLDDFIYIDEAVYSDGSNGLNKKSFKVLEILDPDTIVIGPNATFTGTYIGGGLVARVSQISIKTKEYNFYAKQGRNARINQIDFMVDTTSDGQMLVNYFTSTALVSIGQSGATPNTIPGTSTLDTFPYIAGNAAAPIPFEETATRVWHPVFIEADGEVIQLQLTMNDTQMLNPAITNCDFQFHAICFHANPSSYRFQ
jgi:hypothetical protein